jgi:hypothetical protein
MLSKVLPQIQYETYPNDYAKKRLKINNLI